MAIKKESIMNTDTYQKLYIKYCQENQKEPKEMLAFDKERFPGCCMCGYILWISEKRVEYFKEHGLSRIENLKHWEEFVVNR